MSPINITPINSLNLSRNYGTLSNYAQRFIKSQIRMTTYALDRFFAEIDLKIIPNNEQKLKEFCIKQIGNNKQEGIILSEKECDYHVFFDDEYLNLDILKPNSGEVYQQFKVRENSDKYIHSGNFSDANIEDELSKVLEFVEDKLLKLKRELASAEMPSVLNYRPIMSYNIAEISKTLFQVPKNTDINNAGVIGLKEEEIIKSINNKFEIIQKLYKKISDGRTKYELRSSYKNYLPQTVANKLGFKNIGPNGENICLFDTNYKNNAYTAIILSDKCNNEVKFVISKEDKSVRKNLPSKFVQSENSGYRISLTPNYYTQKELDGLNLYSYLFCLDKEMENFIQHTQNWFNKKEEIKLIKSNRDVATTEQYNRLLDDIRLNFEEYRKKMRTYLRKTHKSKKFKIENGISTKLASTAVKFDNITKEGYDLRLSFPKVREQRAVQILVMSGEKIEKSFFIIDDKLLRFNIKDLDDKIHHSNQKRYYYNKEYLEESQLESYLLILKNKLNELNNKLDAIREKQIQNSIKYHIKVRKGQN